MRRALPVLLGLLLAVGCSRETAPPSGGDSNAPPKHLILIVVDTLRADVLGCYGGDAHTPNIDALAAEGVRFENAYSHIPITGPSHASLFTSLLPSEHGVRNNTQILAEEHLTLAEVLRDAGFHTAAFISLGVLNREFGTAQGFDEYHQNFGGDWWHNARELNEQIMPWIATLESQRQFLWAHFSDPHAPYGPQGFVFPRFDVRIGSETIASLEAAGRLFDLSLVADPGSTKLRFEAGEPAPVRDLLFEEIAVHDQGVKIEPLRGLEPQRTWPPRPAYRSSLPAEFEITNETNEPRNVTVTMTVFEKLSFAEMKERYLLEVEFLDAEIGRLREALEEEGLWQDSLIVFTSDHGEGLGDHGLGGHVNHLYNSLSRVPLMVLAPRRLPVGAVVGNTASLMDLFPTVVDLLEIEVPGGLRGRSLVPLLQGPMAEAAVVAETFRPQAKKDLRALTYKGFRYIITEESGREELYDLRADPGELDDLASEMPDKVVEMRLILKAELAAGRQGVESIEAELSEEEVRQLEALGYVR